MIVSRALSVSMKENLATTSPEDCDFDARWETSPGESVSSVQLRNRGLGRAGFVAKTGDETGAKTGSGAGAGVETGTETSRQRAATARPRNACRHEH
jgi:hypothetical protein